MIRPALRPPKADSALRRRLGRLAMDIVAALNAGKADTPRAVMRRIHARLLRLGLLLLTAGVLESLILPLQPAGFFRQHQWLHTTLTIAAVLLSSIGLL